MTLFKREEGDFMGQGDSKFNKIFNKYNLDKDVRSRILLHLNRTIVGNSEIFMTPIAKEHGTKRILQDLDEMFNLNSGVLNQPLFDLEMANREKVGPRSIAISWSKRRSSLSDSFEVANVDSINELAYPKPNKCLRPLSLSKALTLLKNNTNSGLPYYTRKGKVKQRTLDNFDDLLKMKYPCVLFTRTQEAGKTRNVWGFPIADTLNEMRYYFPLLSYQKRLSYRSVLNSPESVNRRMTEIINKSVIRNNSILSVDFASYDTSVKSQLQSIAFRYIKDLFYYDDTEIEYIAERFNNIGILTPDGVMKGRHGVPSGSTFTNEVDSIVQSIISKSSGLVNDNEYQVQGDDGVYLLTNDSVDKLKSKFRAFGLDVNEDKSYVSHNYAIYLQNLYHKDYEVNGIIGGIYPIYRALNRILFQERWSDFEEYHISGGDFYAIRTLCILENCKYHPLFRNLVKLMLKYDKYSLTTTNNGINDYVRMIKETKGAGEILKHQYGDNVSGILSFETFKLIKELG